MAGTAGDYWTWTALDADSKLIVSWLVGHRDAGYAHEFMSDLAGRLAVADHEEVKVSDAISSGPVAA